MTKTKQTSLEELRSHIILGVVHELNNPNTFIRMNAINEKKLLELLQPCFSEYEKNHPNAKFGPYDLKTCLKKIDLISTATLDATERLISITNRLKQTAASCLEDKKQIELTDIVRQISSDRQVLFKEDIKLVFEGVQGNDFKMMGHAIQLEQAFRVIINNAMEAIASRLENQPTPSGRITVGLTRNQENYYVDFADNGCGMDRATQEKIFIPFFTTKGQGRSRGLGMALCQQIVASHGGTVTVTSQRDVGTRVLITLPIDTGG